MINTAESLQILIDRLAECQRIAIDTEFVWESTYYPALGIVQVGVSEEEVYLVDAATLQDMSPLGAVLANPGIVKILHDAQQDLTILRRVTGAFPKNIFDTRCAAGFVGLTSSVSLTAIVRETLGISLPKTETRTDWLERPLSEKQIEYAEDDVRYLPRLYETLLSGIASRGRETWLGEELRMYDDEALYAETNPGESFWRTKGVGRLSSRELALLRELIFWRESEAQKRNMPRLWILPDETIVKVARRKPRQLAHLTSVRGLSESHVSQYGRGLLHAVKTGLSLPPQECPQREEHPKDDDALTARVDFALAFMKGKSVGAGIDPALLGTRADITTLVREGPDINPDSCRILQGWRHEFMGQDLLMLLQGKLAVRIDTGTGLPRVEDK